MTLLCLQICRLSDENVLDRTAMVNRVEANETKQPALYEDTMHFFSPEPYHAFNWQLLDRLLDISSDR